MAASDRETRLREAHQALARLGIVLERATIETLERALAEEPASALAVAEHLGSVVSREAAALLARLDSGASDKLLRREARRSLYRLRQRGVETESAAPTSAAMPPARPLLGGPEPEGYLSISDSRGDRLLWILKTRPGGGLYHLSTVVNEPAGLREAVLAEVTRKSVRTLREELAARHRLRMIEADWRYCDWIASEGYGRARRGGEAPAAIAQYPQLRLQLFTTPATPVELPQAASTDLAEARLAESASLLEEAELAHWFLGEEDLAGSLARYREVRDSPIVLDRSAQLGRIQEIVHGAVDEVFSGERSTSWRRRLAEAALVFAASNRSDPAGRAAAVATALAARGDGRGIPFCEALVERSFGAFFAREAEREKEEKAGSVLVTPDDIRAEQAARRRSDPRIRS
jgi:hypothetical protein